MSANDGATKTYVLAVAEGSRRELETKGANRIVGGLGPGLSCYSIH